MISDVTPAQYVGDGPVLPGESVHQAMGNNTAYSLGGHLLSQPAQGISSGPHPFEDQPLNDAEAASYKTAQNAYRSTNSDLQTGAQDGTPSPAYSFSHAQAAGQVRQALRPGV